MIVKIPIMNLSRKKVANLLNYLSIGFFLVALVALGWCGTALLEASAFQAYQSRRLENALRMRSASPSGSLTSATRDDSPAEEKPSSQVAALAIPSRINEDKPSRTTLGRMGSQVHDPDLVGRLDIPRIGLSAIVSEGIDNRTLRRALGHIPGTALPGDTGNVGIAGHRDTFFRKLEHIRHNDTITLTTVNGTYRYVVQSIQVVDPDYTEVLRNFGRSTLTLITCYPFRFVGPAPRRFVVKARAVEG
jgi:LPXTG-site transpeptidase (sortase) family protein